MGNGKINVLYWSCMSYTVLTKNALPCVKKLLVGCSKFVHYSICGIFKHLQGIEQWIDPYAYVGPVFTGHKGCCVTLS